MTHAGDAGAFESEVDSTTAAQSYTLQSPWGLTVKRRRLLQTLGLGVYHLEGGAPEPGGPELSVRLKLRLDADAGIATEETTYVPQNVDRFAPGLSVAPVDLMYGYVEGRRLAGGWLGFRAGRQLVSSSLGFWAFDGGLVRVTTPFYVQLEAYGGFEERGGLPLSTPRFERNGIWRGDHTGFDASVYPQFQSAAAAPAYGAALESSGVTWIHGRLDYRKVLNRGTSTISFQPPADPNAGYLQTSGTRTSSDRLGYAFDASAGAGAVKGGLVYDLYAGYFSSYYAAVDWFASKGATIGVDYDYFKPTFDGDFIFNFFTHDPLTTITGRASAAPTDVFDVSASAGVRRFETEGNPQGFYDAADQPVRTVTRQNDLVANLAGRARFPAGLIRLGAMSETGARGHRAGGDLYGERYFSGRRWTALARASLYDFADDLRPDRSATSFGYVLGGAFQPSPAAQATLEWEHDMSRLWGSRFRILAILNLKVTK